MLQRGKGAAIQQVGNNVKEGSLDLTFGEKRALQTVVMVPNKFSPSRTFSIR